MKQPIVVITKAFHLYETIQTVLKKHNLNYPVYYGIDSDTCLEMARKLVDNGTQVIVSTDYLCKLFMQELNVSVIGIRRSGYSFISSVSEELHTVDKIAIISIAGNFSFRRAAEEAHMINPERIFIFEYNSADEVPAILSRLHSEGFHSVLCPSWIGPAVLNCGMKYLETQLPESDILEAMDQAKYQLHVIQLLALSDNMFSKILNLSSEGIIAIDESGIVIDVNDSACTMLKVQKYELVKKNFRNTILRAFDAHGEITRHLEVRSSILTLNEQMLVYDVQSVLLEDALAAQIITFKSAQQIKEAERSIRMREIKQGSPAISNFSSIIGGSPAIVQAVQNAKRFARVNSTVLITAPSGCGKELFAQSIHNASMRANNPFVVINCAALPESVLESLLFGYEPGTFTGGKREGKAGLFEQAHGGTVFLDEVSEMPLNIQARFLRVLQEREVVRIGGSRGIPIDIRVLAATNRNMWKLIQEGRFREDLYHRISTLLLEIPPLSQRKEDIEPLAQYFIYKRSSELNLPIIGIDSQAIQVLSGLNFTGNVRQLNNILERAMVLASSETIRAADIRNALPKTSEYAFGSVEPPGSPAFTVSVPNFSKTPSVPYEANDTTSASSVGVFSLSQQAKRSERELIIHALGVSGESRAKAAAMLGISTTTLWRKMKAFHIA